MVPSLLQLLVRSTGELTVLRLPEPSHPRSRVERLIRLSHAVHSPTDSHQGQIDPDQETHALRPILTRSLRHHLLHPLQILQSVATIRTRMGRLVRS